MSNATLPGRLPPDQRHTPAAIHKVQAKLPHSALGRVQARFAPSAERRAAHLARAPGYSPKQDTHI